MKPVHLSIVGGEPLVRYRELDEILPRLAGDGHSHAGRHERRAADSGRAGRRIPRVQVCVSIDGLQPEHDVRRAPATYDRILKHIKGQQVTVHCTVTRQQTRPGYVTEFAEFWSAQPDVQAHLVQPVHAAEGRGVRRDAAARGSRSASSRRSRALRARMPKLRDMRPGVAARATCTRRRIPTRASSRRRRRACRRTSRRGSRRASSAAIRIAAQCGCMATAALDAVGRYRLPGGLRAGQLYWASRQVGNGVRCCGAGRLRGRVARVQSRPPAQARHSAARQSGADHTAERLDRCDIVNGCAPVAQLDRAPGFEPVGRGFKSLRAHQLCARTAELQSS